MRIISRTSVITFDRSLIIEAITKACDSIKDHNDIVDQLNELLNDELTEEQYQEQMNDQIASFHHNHQNEPFYMLNSRINAKGMKKHDPVQQSILSFLQKRRRRQGSRISQGDLNSTSMDESMPIPPTFEKGGMHYTAEIGV